MQGLLLLTGHPCLSPLSPGCIPMHGHYCPPLLSPAPQALALPGLPAASLCAELGTALMLNFRQGWKEASLPRRQRFLLSEAL